MCLWSLFTTVLLFPLHLVFIFVRSLSHCSINEGESNLWRKIYVAAILTHETWNFTMLNIQHVLAWYYLRLIALVSSHQSLKKKKDIYSIVLLNYRYRFVCYERSDGNMEKRTYHDVPAKGNTFASVFLVTESSILQCF